MRFNPDNPHPDHADLVARYDPDVLLMDGNPALSRLRMQGGPDAWSSVVRFLQAARGTADTADAELLDWLLTEPTGLRLVERWGREVHERASAVLRATEDPEDPEARADGYPPAVARVLGALTPDTRALVRAELLHKAPAAADERRERWRRLAVAWRWLGVDPEPGGYAERPETYEPDPEPGSPYLIPGLWWRDTEDPPRFLRALARDLWAARWRDEARELHKRARMTFAQTTRTVEALVGLVSPASTVEDTGTDLRVVGVDRRTVHGQMTADDLAAVRRMMEGRGLVVDSNAVREHAREVIEATRTNMGVSVFFHAAVSAWADYQKGGTGTSEWANWRDYATAVADYSGVKLDPHARTLICDAAWAGNAVQLRLWDGRWQRGLWTLTAPDPRKRGAPRADEDRRVSFRYAPLLLPGWAAMENPRDRNRGTALLALRETMPTVHVADPAQKAPAVLFSLMLLVEVCTETRPDAVGDGAAVSGARRAALARAVGLRDEGATAQLRGLLDEGLLIEVRRDRYALGDPEARALRAYKRPAPSRRRGG